MSEDRPGRSRSFDHRALVERVAGDGELLRQVVELFCADTPPRLAELARALDSGDLKLARETAHALKGGVSMFEADPAFRAAVRMEDLVPHATTEELRAALQRVEDEYLRLCRELEEFAAGF